MIKLIKYFSLLTLLLLNISCEDDLNPFVKGEDIFILNCVLKNDRSNQTAFLSKNYFVDNFNPKSDTNDHSVKDAYIRIFYNDSVKIFSDTLLQKNVSSNQKVTSYFNNNFLTKPDTEYELEAILNDGRKLKAVTKTPQKVSFLFSSDNIIPPADKNDVAVYWESADDQLYTAARFIFVYFKNENGKQVRYEKEVPRAYVLQNSKYVPYFPEPSYAKTIRVEMDAFNRALREISEGDPDKSNYTILAFILEILVYDKNLTAYYASKTELGEGFSITVNENDYSNITGGKGIFGSFIKQRFAIKFSIDYIQTFGYVAGLTEDAND